MTTENVDTKKGLSRRKKQALIGTGAVTGLVAAGVLASWTGTVSFDPFELSSAEFVVETSTDGGATWTAYSSNGESLEANLGFETEHWGPGESETVEFILRMAEDSPYSGVISGEGGIVLEELNSGQLPTGFDFTLGSDDAATASVPLVSGSSGQLVSDASEDFELAADAGNEVTFDLTVASNDELPQDQIASLGLTVGVDLND